MRRDLSHQSRGRCTLSPRPIPSLENLAVGRLRCVPVLPLFLFLWIVGGAQVRKVVERVCGNSLLQEGSMGSKCKRAKVVGNYAWSLFCACPFSGKRKAC